jgi:hypothetical protein
MKRLSQFGILLLLIATIVAPIAELLDSWDAAGLCNDTEFGALVLVFTLAFVLVVCMLIAKLAFLAAMPSVLRLRPPEETAHAQRFSLLTLLMPPRLTTPLLI